MQSHEDHVQPNNNHAIDIINAAVAGSCPWVRLNDHPPNQTYSYENPPEMLADDLDRRTDILIVEYARDIIENVLPELP